MRKPTRVVLTDHFSERYGERVGKAPPRCQKSWIASTIRKRRPKRQGDGKFKLKLLGSRHIVILAREAGNTWVAVTIK